MALLAALGTRVRLGRLRNMRRPAPEAPGAVLDLDELGGAQVAMPGDDPLLDAALEPDPLLHEQWGGTVPEVEDGEEQWAGTGPESGTP